MPYALAEILFPCPRTHRDHITLATRYEGRINDQELDFMSGLLCMDPSRRLTSAQCLAHPYLEGLSDESERAACLSLSSRGSNLTPMGDPYVCAGGRRGGAFPQASDSEGAVRSGDVPSASTTPAMSCAATPEQFATEVQRQASSRNTMPEHFAMEEQQQMSSHTTTPDGLGMELQRQASSRTTTSEELGVDAQRDCSLEQPGADRQWQVPSGTATPEQPDVGRQRGSGGSVCEQQPQAEAAALETPLVVEPADVEALVGSHMTDMEAEQVAGGDVAA